MPPMIQTIRFKNASRDSAMSEPGVQYQVSQPPCILPRAHCGDCNVLVTCGDATSHYKGNCLKAEGCSMPAI